MTSIQNDETNLTDLIKLSQALSVPCKVVERGIIVITLSQKGTRQVQLIVIPPWTKVPEHNHPCVNKFIKFLSGSGLCSRGSKSKHFKIEYTEPPVKLYHISAGVNHSVETFEEHLAYISVQDWLGGGVKSIEEDWCGKEKL